MSDLIKILIIGALGYLVYTQVSIVSRPDMIDYLNVETGPHEAFLQMSDKELRDVYNYVRSVQEQIPITPDLASRITTIGKKYNIFT